MNSPLVSIIIPTRNSAQYLEACLKSVKEQTYKNIEMIVVDNNSTDATKEIAQKYTTKVFNKGPERSAQRNFGVSESQGSYVLIIDSDMELSPKVVEACVEKINSDSSIKALIIPEESFGIGFWAQCKKLERSFYVGVEWMEAARFFDKETYIKVDGYNEKMVSGEDWDLSQRVEKIGKKSRIKEFIYHNEGKINLFTSVKKKFYYAQQFRNYTNNQNNETNVKSQTGIISRYRLFLSQPSKLFRNPLLGFGMLFMKTCEFGMGGIGYLSSSKKSHV